MYNEETAVDALDNKKNLLQCKVMLHNYGKVSVTYISPMILHIACGLSVWSTLDCGLWFGIQIFSICLHATTQTEKTWLLAFFMAEIEDTEGLLKTSHVPAEKWTQ